jgi:hypothetical protein
MRVFVWDYEGNVLAATSFTKVKILEPIVVEALATLHTTKFNGDLGLHKIILKGDTLHVVNVVKFT